MKFHGFSILQFFKKMRISLFDLQKEAETHLPHLVASEGVLLTMTDYDTAQSWTFRYRLVLQTHKLVDCSML